MANVDKKKLNAEIAGTLFNDIERFEMFFMTYWKVIAGASLAVVILIAAGFYVATARKAAAKQAAHALSDASTIEELTAALEKHAGAHGSAFARFRLASLQISAKKYADAEKQLNRLLSETDEVSLQSEAKILKAYLLELNGKLPEAANAFAKIGSDVKLLSRVRSEANFCAGRLYVDLKKNDEAKNALSKAAADTQSLWGVQAKAMLANLRSAK